MRLQHWIHHHADRSPERLAIRFPGLDSSYGMLAQRVDRHASALAASGVTRGSRVAFLGLNHPDEIALLFACARLGAMFVPLNWRLAAPEHEQILGDCTPAVLFVEAPFVEQTETLRAGLKTTLLVSRDSTAPGWVDGEAFLARGDRPAPCDASVGADAPLLISYTSGSTGRPKGVVLSHGALECNAANSADMQDMVPEDRILTTLPLFHVGGLNNQTTPGLSVGCTIVMHPKFDVDATFDAIEQERITLGQLVPAQISMMMQSPRWGRADFSSLRLILTGSAVVPEHQIHAVHACGVPLVQVYGATETCPIAACLKASEAGRKLGSSGRAAKHCELRIVDESGQDVAMGVTGEILVRGRNVMSGYWNAPQATAEVLIDGWYHTGDMGHLDAEGFLYVDGRHKELIISGGENIYPAEIENLLTESPDIAEASVVGCPDARWGEVVVAVVVPHSGRQLSESEVMSRLAGRIARFKQPRKVLFTNELPKTALGKIRRDEVRRMAAESTSGG